MANDRSLRDRGNLFENKDKKKPSQPDVQGDCSIDGTAYEIRGFRRGDELTVHLAPPRGDQNTYPPDVFRGTLEAVPVRPVRANPRGPKPADLPQAPSWVGDLVSDEAAYKISAFEKQGKSGMYYTLSFERIERPVAESVAPADADADDDD
jgi:hypothetical protein